jgi:hypothetical protein
MNDTLARWSRAAIWCLPVYGALTLAATVSQQPDPATQFGAWSEYVTTGWFYSSHLGASLIGLALGTLGVVGLGVVLAGGRRPRAALTALALHVLGAAFVLGLFGVAAFVQPAVGAAFLGGEAAAQGWYDAVFNSARTLVPAVAGLLVFSAASVVMAWSLAGHPDLPRWLAWLFGVTAPFIGLLGLMVSLLQPLGAALLIVSGTLLAVQLREGATAPAARAAGRARGQALGGSPIEPSASRHAARAYRSATSRGVHFPRVCVVVGQARHRRHSHATSSACTTSLLPAGLAPAVWRT